jgi:hypothetical protein
VSTLRWASRYRCDFCGLVADIPPRPDDEVWPAPVPEGWMLVYGGEPGALRVSVEDAQGQRFGDICADCTQLSLLGLVDMLRRRLAGEPAR